MTSLPECRSLGAGSCPEIMLGPCWARCLDDARKSCRNNSIIDRFEFRKRTKPCRSAHRARTQFHGVDRTNRGWLGQVSPIGSMSSAIIPDSMFGIYSGSLLCGRSKSLKSWRARVDSNRWPQDYLLTVMPSGPSFWASERVSAIIPPFERSEYVTSMIGEAGDLRNADALQVKVARAQKRVGSNLIPIS